MGTTFGSVCSGIEAASVAWHPLGWEAAWFAEIDKAASLVLAHRFPHVRNHGDMTKLAGMVRRREIEAPDILVGGTPCQAFSIAGRREGLNDTRGQLTLSFVELADAIDDVRAAAGKPPCVIVWENVPGVLSDKTGAFGCFLAGIAGEDHALEPGPRPEPGRSSTHWGWEKKTGKHHPKWSNAGVVAGPQRTIAWRTLDAQYFGLAQRRRRVFVVASAGAGFDPAAVLLEFEGLRRDSPPSREAREDVTHATAPCLTSSGRGVQRVGEPRGQDPIVAVAGTLDARAAGGGFPGTDGALDGHVVPVFDGGGRPDRLSYGGGRTSGAVDVAACLVAKGQKLDFEVETFVVEPAPDVYSIMPMNSGKDYKARRVEVAQPLMAAGPVGGNQGGDYVLQPPIAFSAKDYGADATADLSPTLRAGGHKGSHENGGVMPAVAYPEPISFHPTQDPIFDEDGICHALGTGGTGGSASAAVAYSVALRGREGGGTIELGDEVAHCLRASTGGGDKPHVLEVIPFDTTQITCPNNYSKPKAGDPCHPLVAGGHPPAVCVTGEVTHTLKADGFDGSENGTGRGQPIVYCEPGYIHPRQCRNSQSSNQIGIKPDAKVADALTSEGPGAIFQNMAVRRLMPPECEILQGFPPGWTLVPVKKVKAPKAGDYDFVQIDGQWWQLAADGPRYKQCGNSMATTVMRWIGSRIRAQMSLIIDEALLGLLEPEEDLIG